MIALIAAASSAMIMSCHPLSTPLKARHYQPHHIGTAREAVVAAHQQFAEFAPNTQPLDVWMKAYKAYRYDTMWNLDVTLGGADHKFWLDEKDGRIQCAWVLN